MHCLTQQQRLTAEFLQATKHGIHYGKTNKAAHDVDGSGAYQDEASHMHALGPCKCKHDHLQLSTDHHSIEFIEGMAVN